jgi:hypothetical protein
MNGPNRPDRTVPSVRFEPLAWQHAFTISLTHSRARGADDGGRRRRDASYGVCELRGGARQPSGFNNSVRGGARQPSGFNNSVRGALMASLAERTASRWTATSMRDRPAGCSTCASSLCGAVCGNGPVAGSRRRWFVGADRSPAKIRRHASDDVRATGWRATAIRFQQFGEGGPAFTISLTHSRARGADDGGRRRRDASYGVCELRGGARQPSGFNNSVRTR